MSTAGNDSETKRTVEEKIEDQGPGRLPTCTIESDAQAPLVPPNDVKVQELTSPMNEPHAGKSESTEEVPDDSKDQRPARTRKMTERGAIFEFDQATTKFNNAVKSHKRNTTMARNRMEGGNVSLDELNTFREVISRSINEVQNCYFNLRRIPLSEEQLKNYDSITDECQERSSQILFDITSQIGSLKTGKNVLDNCGISERSRSHRSHRSKSSRHSKMTGRSCQSGSSAARHSDRSSRSSRSSRSGSSAAIRADAAANAAALRAKLKYCEAELEQQAKLDKLRLIKELEVEEARLEAVTNIEGFSCKNVSNTRKYDFDSRLASGQRAMTSRIPTDSLPVNSVVHDCPTDRHESVVIPDASGSKPVHTIDSQFRHSCDVVRTQGCVPQDTKDVCKQNHESMNATNDFVEDRSSGVQTSELNCKASEFIPRATRTSDSEVVNLVKQLSILMSNNRLPIPEPGVFCGDPIEFPAWRQAFTTLIENRNIVDEEKVYYLKRYLGGNAKSCVEGFLLMPTGDSFRAAMKLIDKRFGNSFAVAQAFKAKIEEWPKIGPKDSHGLQKFSDFLCQCEVAARSNPSLRVLNDDVQNKVMLQKLPDWFVTRWARKVHDFTEKFECYPNFEQFASFLSYEAEIACNPITAVNTIKSVTGSQGQKRSNSTQEFNSRSLHTNQMRQECLLCHKTNHALDDCIQFKKKSLEEKKVFVMNNKLCFGCLKVGHISKSCPCRLKCSVCKKRHPTSLHGYTKEKPVTSSEVEDNGKMASRKDVFDSSAGDPDKSNYRSGVSSGVSEGVSMLASQVCKSSMIVPVYVSHVDNPGQETLTYALLDTQSDTSFVAEQVCRNLEVSGIATHLRLSTMTTEGMLMSCQRVTDLQVRGFNSSQRLPLPPLFTHGNIPADEDSIPVPSIAELWPYLQPVVGQLMPKSNCGVGLLIGFNCPPALAPREVIPPEGDGPFAQRTDLGWGIIGLMRISERSLVAVTQAEAYSPASQITLRTRAKDRKSTRLNSSHVSESRMPSSA